MMIDTGYNPETVGYYSIGNIQPETDEAALRADIRRTYYHLDEMGCSHAEIIARLERDYERGDIDYALA